MAMHWSNHKHKQDILSQAAIETAILQQGGML